MIRYTLSCADGHRFESWFQSADAFDKLHAAGMVACAVCGGTQVQKTLMAPSVATDTPAAPAEPDAPKLSTPASPAEQALAELKRKIEAHSDYVGPRFAQEARDMHAGLTPERAIHGEARLDEAKKLIEEGIPVAPLPFAPGRKTN
ncbi:DUF1178 family protein [Rhodovulum adriaticum]|uniref:DUF1178 family protein n=1 Tax=Rhodovulum adriaticum TaxID=35804 RepID=A0A4R2NMG6_RHOAD|nr:DUF1178 family protein [Rhodovulum adriaticum]MBK1636374.1 hypothetical protein [Rhodovulum adriaticum]TCP22863.1 hypothetical protein EV656_105165 [Rhodovulum adriaticum]